MTRKPKGPLVIQCDELWSFVGAKRNQDWLWLALDQSAREIVGGHLGHRDHLGAQGLWASLPQFIVNVRLVIPISGLPTHLCYLPRGINLPLRAVARRITLNVSIIRFVNLFQD